MSTAAQRLGLQAGHRTGQQAGEVLHLRGQREDMTTRFLNNLELRET